MPQTYAQIFETIGLSKNEGRIYEALIRHGELSVGGIATRSKVNRRNVYDAIPRLIERGLVYEIVEARESRYQPVDPEALRSIIKEKEELLVSVMPELNRLYTSTTVHEAVHVYRGVEGWRQYMREIIRVGEDFYCIGAKGAWWEERLQHFMPQFQREAKRKGIKYYHLFDHEVKVANHEVLKHVGPNYKFLPPEYSSRASIDFFGDRVNITSKIHLGGVEDDISITVIINPIVADGFRTWFQFMWDFCPNET